MPDCEEVIRGLHELPYYVTLILFMNYIAKVKCVNVAEIIEKAHVDRGLITMIHRDIERMGFSEQKDENAWCLSTPRSQA